MGIPLGQKLDQKSEFCDGCLLFPQDFKHLEQPNIFHLERNVLSAMNKNLGSYIASFFLFVIFAYGSMIPHKLVFNLRTLN